MNLDAEKTQLIDFSIEDDFLIDSEFDNTFVDLRLSVTLETQKELVSDPKSMIRRGMKERVANFGENEHKNFGLEKGNDDIECNNARKSLAWDRAFFTSPGFLELEELWLVNSGFRDLDVTSSHEVEDNVKSKASGQRRNLCLKPGVGATGKQKIQSSMKTKVTSPSKMVSTCGSIRPQMTAGRSEVASRSTVAKSQFNNTSSRKEALKSTRTMSQTRVSAVHNRKPPLRAAVSRNGQGMMVSQQLDSRSPNSVSSTQSLLPSYATTRSVDFLPCKTFMDNLQTASSLKSKEVQDGSFSFGINASQAYNLKGHRNNYRDQSASMKQGPGHDVLTQTEVTETKRSPISSKTSSLRMPSQNIGYFDINLETNKHEKHGFKSSDKGQSRSRKPICKKQTHSLANEQKENIIHPEDYTVTEFEGNKGSPSPSQLAADGSSPSTAQCSSTSKKSLAKTQLPKRQTLVSPTPRSRRTTSFTKVSPLKKSAYF